jgi:hypothetical protein
MTSLGRPSCSGGRPLVTAAETGPFAAFAFIVNLRDLRGFVVHLLIFAVYGNKLRVE